VTTDDCSLNFPQALDALVSLVREWREAGRVTTTAGLKAGLTQHTEGAFSETALGFDSFRAFVEAAAQEGRVQLNQLPSGHWIVLLPGESMSDVPTTSRSRPVAVAGSPREAVDLSRRLRRDIWPSFVDWTPGQRRIWDRTTRRSIMYPVDDAGCPLWETDDARFVEMPAADMGLQLQWMREWAATLTPDTTRDAVLASIGGTGRAGQFRAQLERFGLAAGWRVELHRRVLQHAAAWARANKIELDALLEPRVVTTTRSPVAPTSGTSASTAPADELTKLRVRMHKIIDRMSLVELASLPVRAEYLLGSDL